MWPWRLVSISSFRPIKGLNHFLSIIEPYDSFIVLYFHLDQTMQAAILVLTKDASSTATTQVSLK